MSVINPVHNGNKNAGCLFHADGWFFDTYNFMNFELF